MNSRLVVRAKFDSEAIPLIVVGPLPPPIHGVTISTGLVLKNDRLRDEFEVVHLDTSDRRGLSNLGSWDLRNVSIGLKSAFRLVRLLRPAQGLLYLPLSQNGAAFLRDSLFIHLAHLRGWKIAVHLRGGEFDLFYTSTGRGFRFLIRQTLRRIASIGVLGSGLVGMFDGLFEPERIRVVCNGTPSVQLSSDCRHPDRILFMANLLRRKGVQEAVEAALMVVARHPSAHFVFAGAWEDGVLASELEGRAAVADGRISFRSPVSGHEKIRLLAAAGIFVFPPREPEGQPRAVLEAMAAGLPVITTDRGALGETVVDGETGFVLRDPVAEEIADCILDLLGDPVRQGTMGRNAEIRHGALYTQEQADIALAVWLQDVTRDQVDSRPRDRVTRDPVRSRT
jgi:glycosyltransferase involved in cell wall biosynthesis